MRFLRITYNSQKAQDAIVRREAFEKIFQRVELEDGSFTPEEYVPGSSGERKLFDLLIEQSGLNPFR